MTREKIHKETLRLQRKSVLFGQQTEVLNKFVKFHRADRPVLTVLPKINLAILWGACYTGFITIKERRRFMEKTKLPTFGDVDDLIFRDETWCQSER